MLGKQFKCEFSVSEAIGQLVIWVLLTIITLGLALFVMPYYFLKAPPLNRTYVLDSDGEKIGRVSVDVTFGDVLGHALVWLLCPLSRSGWPISSIGPR